MLISSLLSSVNAHAESPEESDIAHRERYGVEKPRPLRLAAPVPEGSSLRICLYMPACYG